MEPYELNRMFDQLAPTPEQEANGLDRLLHEERKVKPMKKLKKLTVVGIAAALMAVTCAAAVVTGVDRRLADYFGASPEQVELLTPGAVPLDITVENNGATLHVTQVLMDRYNIMILADFTASKGTVLDMDEEHDVDRGFGGMAWSVPELLDQEGKEIDLGSWGWQTKVLDDGDPLDNHLSLLMCMNLNEGIQPGWEISSVALPAKNLVRYDPELNQYVTVYSGDWSCQFSIAWQDTGWSMQPEQVIGQIDGSDVRVTEVYLSPMTLYIHLVYEIPVSNEPERGINKNWLRAVNQDDIMLTSKDGQTFSLTPIDGTATNREQDLSIQLPEILDPAQFRGGTLTLRIGDGSVDIPLDNLVPAE